MGSLLNPFTVVFRDGNSNERYLLAINQDLSADPNELDCIDDSSLLPVNLNCRPLYTYYDNHCGRFHIKSSSGFPIIPPSESYGSYNGNEYFVFERVSRSLSSVVSDTSLVVTDEDLFTIAFQLLEIVRICFAEGKVFKNLHVNDFFFRRTTRGYRIVLLNQDFFSKKGAKGAVSRVESASSSRIRRSPLFP